MRYSLDVADVVDVKVKVEAGFDPKLNIFHTIFQNSNKNKFQ